MNKATIKALLEKRFISETSEASVPGVVAQKKHLKDSGKENKAGVAAIEKDVKEFDKASKDKNANQMVPNKFNYTDKFQETYHDEMEIMNGQEMLQYDLKPSEKFQERAKEGIEGSSKMGNQGKIGNAEETWGASKDSFGKDLVKKIKASTKKRSDETPTLNLRGRDIQADVKDTGHRPYAVEEGVKPKTPLSEKNKLVITNWITKLGSKQAAEKLINAMSETGMVSDLPDSNEYGAGLNRIEALLTSKNLDNAYHLAKALAKKLEKKAMRDMMENKDNDKPQIKESMKRLKFKNPFNGLGNALKLIPEGYRVDKKEFEMTDGNEAYKIRWEGTLTEGKAVVLTAKDKQLVNENITRMKELFNYKSEKTLGTVKGNARIDENKVFADIWNKSKMLIEGEDMFDGEAPKAKEGEWEEAKGKQAPEAKKHVEKSMTGKGNSTAKPKEGHWEDVKGGEKMFDGEAPAPKEGEWDGISVKQAPEAKKHVQGSVSTEKGTQAPKPKEGHWEEAKIGQATEAKKHVTLKETEEEEMPMTEEEEIDEPAVAEPEVDDNGPEPEDDSNIMTRDAEPEPEEKEPTAKDLGNTSGVEDVTAAPAVKGKVQLMQSESRPGEYWINNNGSNVRVPEEFLHIAKMAGKKGSEKAAIIIQKMEAQVPDVDGLDDAI